MRRAAILAFASLILFLLAACKQQSDVIKNVDVLTTEVTGVRTETIDYNGHIGYLAKPKKEGLYPGIVMIHEWWGLNDNIQEMAMQLASEGYVVLAVDLYDGHVAVNATEARVLADSVRNNMPKAIQNMKAAAEFLKKQDNVNKNLIASLGWCFGGAMSLQLALNEKLAATVIYYGSLETNATKLSAIEWPVLGIFGSLDTSIPIETVKKFEAALNEAGVENEIHIYDGVGHAFANPSGANYAPDQTKDAWQKTLQFLEKNLKAKFEA